MSSCWDMTIVILTSRNRCRHIHVELPLLHEVGCRHVEGAKCRVEGVECCFKGAKCHVRMNCAAVVTPHGCGKDF